MWRLGGDRGRRARDRRSSDPGAFVWLLAAAASFSRVQGEAQGQGLAPGREVAVAGDTVRFRSTEGTWMSLDVSPDGQTIVFELLGDLFTLPIAGGTAHRITSGPSFDRQPRYSPDGRRLVFVSDRGGRANLWITDRSGDHPRQLSQLRGPRSNGIASPAWAPDGRTVVVSQMLAATATSYSAHDHGTVWLLAAYDVASGAMRWISDTTTGSIRAALGPAFGPRSDAVYASVDVAGAAPGQPESWRLMRGAMADGRMSPVLGRDVTGIAVRPALSPDGKYLTYASSSGASLGLRLRELHSGKERWLVRDSPDNIPIHAAGQTRDLMPGYAFTPDSKSLIVAFGGKMHRVELASGRRHVIPFVAAVEQLLTPSSVHRFSIPDTTRRTRSVLQPALSPTGDRVAFSALGRIWIMRLPRNGAPAGAPWRLTNESAGEFYPSWSPDGDWIVFSAWADGVGGALRRARVMQRSTQAGPSQRLTADTAQYFHSAVAPDSARIVAVRAAVGRDRVLTHAEGLKTELIWIPWQGGAPSVITSLSAGRTGWQHEWFGFRYPADQVYFTADAGRVYSGLTSWSWNAGDRRAAVALSTTRESWRPEAWGVVSPDGSRALASDHRYGLFELTLPVPDADFRGTLDLDQARDRPFGSPAGAATRWGRAHAPWISWSQNGRRALFGQGGTFFVGEVDSARWTAFAPVRVELPVPTDVPQGTILLRGARLITMRGAEVIERGDLLVRNNRIIGVGPEGQVPVPGGTRVLDLAGKTILPGYVDLHDHLWLLKGLHPEQSWQLLLRLAHGVTASRDPEPVYSNEIFTYAERERTGELLGPRIFSTGIVYDVHPEPPTPAAAREAVLPNAAYFDSETFKLHIGEPSANRRAERLLARALAESELNATVHVSGAQQALTAAIDGFSGIEHAPTIRVYADFAQLIAASGATYTHTYGALPGFSDYMFAQHGSPWSIAKMRRFTPPAERPAIRRSIPLDGPPERSNLLALTNGAARIAESGGRVGIGSHGNVHGLGYHYELWLHALGGMPNHNILRSATIVGATAIGHEADLGSLEPGKLADLQVLDRNPLEDIHHTTSIRYVMKNGRLYQADDLTETWPRRRTLPRKYLWDH